MKQRLSLFRSVISSLGLVAALTLASCGGSRPDPDPRPVSLTITVVDSQDNLWIDMPVRIHEAWNEWSDDYRRGKDPWATLKSDDRGEVFFSSEDIADADLGFLETDDRRATLAYEHWRNEAEYTIEIGTDRLGYVELQIPVHFRNTHLDVIIEFEPGPALLGQSLEQTPGTRRADTEAPALGQARATWRLREAPQPPLQQ